MRLKHFVSMFFMLFALSVGQVWATPDESVTFSSQGYSNQQAVSSYNGTDFSITFDKGTNSNNPPKYYTSGTAIRAYGGNTMTISSSTKTITEIVITFGTSDGSNAITTDVATYSNGTWSGSAASVTFTIGGTSGNRRLSAIAITYASGGGNTPTLSVSPSTIDFGTVEQGTSVANKTVAVSFANLTGSVVYSGLQNTPFTASGAISATGDEIAIAANTANLGEYEETLTVQSSTDALSKTVTVTMNVIEPFNGLQLTFPDYNDAAISLYTDSWTATKNGQVWDIYGFNNNNNGWAYIKAGRKKGSNKDAQPVTATIETQVEDHAIGDIVVTVDAFTDDQITSHKLYVADNSSYTDAIEIDGDPSTIAVGNITYTVPEANRANDLYYKLEYVTAGTASSNGTLTISKITYAYATAASTDVEKPTISGTTPFFTDQTAVTITCATTGAAIYYTTDGTTPTSNSTLYEGEFNINTSSTVRAIAIKGNGESPVATKEFTKIVAKTTAAQLVEFATSTEKSVYVNLQGWQVTFVNGDYVYLVDSNNQGVVLNETGHGYTTGDVLGNAIVSVQAKKSSGRVQLSGFTSSDIAATSGTATITEVTDFSTLTAANQSALVTLKNATYSSDGTFSDGTNTVYYYNQFSLSPAPTLLNDAVYDVTGIVIYYKSGNTEKVEIAPRYTTDVEAKQVIVIPTAANLAALKAAERGTYILTLTNAVITYVSGKNAFIEEGTTGAFIFVDNHGYAAGDCISGEYQVTTTDYSGKFEITAMEAQDGTTKTTATVPVTTLTLEQLNANFAAYESRRIKVESVNVTDAISGSDREGEISDGTNTCILYAGVSNTISATADTYIDVIGYPTFHEKNNATQQQLAVWAQNDITVIEREEAGLAYNPTSDEITAGDAWTQPQLVNPNNLTGITYSSTNGDVATVTDGGEIALAGGHGTAVITAHRDADANYYAGNATYTITVNAATQSPEYIMSFDLTRASYDAAATNQVVWNSSVVTVTANKNSASTTLLNYLAGNYSTGGTPKLIAETRFYSGHSVNFVPQTGVTITKVEWTTKGENYATNVVNSTWTNASAAVDQLDHTVAVVTPTSNEFSVTLGGQVQSTDIIVYYTTSDDQEKSKLAASISIEDINMTVGDDDILLSDVDVTSNPNKKVVSYEITSGDSYVSIVGEGKDAAFHAIAEGTATITATIPDDLGNYGGATTTFNIVVAEATLTETGLAYNPTSDEITAGDAWTQPQLVNPNNLTGITYNSNNGDVATVTDGGEIALAGGYGTAVITAHRDADGTYLAANVTYTIIVNEPVINDDVTGTWTLVTNATTLAAGKKVIIAQYVEADGNIQTMAAQSANGNNRTAITSTVAETTLTPAVGTKVMTLADAGEGHFYLMTSDGKYLYNASTDKKSYLKTKAEAENTSWTIEVNAESKASINSVENTNRTKIFYNSNNDLFNCYASGQSDIALYMHEETTPEPPTPSTPDYVRDVTSGQMGTICLPNAVAAGDYTGATMYSIAYKTSNPVSVELVEENEGLVAGRPYIFIANANKIEVNYTGDATEELHPYHGLYGCLEPMVIDNTVNIGGYTKDAYMLSGGKIKRCGINCTLQANRAYIVMDNVPEQGGNTQQIPGRRYISLMVEDMQTPTALDEVTATEENAKFILNGQLYILRDGKLYNAQGQLVK